MPQGNEVKTVGDLAAKSTRVSQWQLITAILTLLVTAATLIVQAGGALTVALVFVVVLLVVSLIRI